MTDKKPDLDPVVLAGIYANLLHMFSDGVERKRREASPRMKNFVEGVINFLSIVAFRHMTTPIAIVDWVQYGWLKQNKRFGLKTMGRSLHVFGVRLVRWPVKHDLVEYEVSKAAVDEHMKEEAAADIEEKP